ncbi:MAG: hypothetical protein KDC97_12540 [Confluentibacter sp.]|nr:hypothetical protein [Confluentibacter sp.]
MKEKLPLNKQDIKKIRNYLIPILAFPFLAMGMFYGFYSFFLSDTEILGDKTGQYMLVGFGVFFFGIIAYMASTAVIDLRQGFKYRISGKITDKKLSVHTSTTHTSNGKTGSSSSRSSTTRHYYLYINDVQYPIDQQHYGKVKVGNVVILEKAPKSHLTLLFEVTNAHEISLDQPIETDETSRQSLNNIPKKVPLRQADFEALKRGLITKLKTRLMWFLPPLSITVLLTLNGMQGFLVFLFPLVLIPAYQLWKFSREFLEYNRNRQYAYKEGIPAIVEDKSKYSHNGKVLNIVRTNQGNLNVNHQLYGQLNTGDKIILFKPARGKQIISIQTINNEELYVM